jgi:hypothetical protein
MLGCDQGIAVMHETSIKKIDRSGRRTGQKMYACEAMTFAHNPHRDVFTCERIAQMLPLGKSLSILVSERQTTLFDFFPCHFHQEFHVPSLSTGHPLTGDG